MTDINPRMSEIFSPSTEVPIAGFSGIVIVDYLQLTPAKETDSYSQDLLVEVR